MRSIRTAGLVALLAMASCTPGTDEKGVQDIYDVTPKVTRPLVPGKKSVAFIIDTSGSMDSKLDGVRKIDAAKQSLQSVLAQYHAHNQQFHNLQAGLFYFSMEDVQCLVPIGDFDYATLSSKVSNLSAQGGTPLGVSLAYAERSLDEQGDGTKNIVLLTDGANTSGRSPEQVFQNIQETNVKTGDRPTQLYVIAFDTDPKNFSGLKDLGAKVLSAQDTSELSMVLGQTKDLILEAPDDSPKPF